jgi:hypothetical protein
MIEGCNPRHICIDLTHFTSQSKIFDTSGFLQIACQVLLIVMLNSKLNIVGVLEGDLNGKTDIPAA